MSRVVLVLHGTASAAGQDVAHRLAGAVAGRLGTPTVAGFVDVVGPHPAELADASSTLVPVFLGSGYHVQVDVEQVREATGARVTEPLNPGVEPPPELLDALAGRMDEAGGQTDEAGGPGSGVVLGWAGSSARRSREQVQAVADALARRWGVPVEPATPDGALEVLARTGAAAVCSYLLAPGRFADRLAALRSPAGDPLRVSAPIGVHPRLVDLVCARVVS